MKGQHALNLCALNLCALAEVIAVRDKKLGFNIKLIIETNEERGSRGLREFVEKNQEQLKADVLIASDGPHFCQKVPTIFTATRGIYNFDLLVQTSQSPLHSGNWGGIAKDPAILLSHAISSICDQRGKILIRDWFPKEEVNSAVIKAISHIKLENESLFENWGEPNKSAAEKLLAFPSFTVIGMSSGNTTLPVNAIAPLAIAKCQIRYTVDSNPEIFLSSLRAHLDRLGLEEVRIENSGVLMEASRTDPSHPWILWAAKSREKTLGTYPDVIPNAGGSLPGNIFADCLNLPLIWIPHSYSDCEQHGPNEHLLVSLAREGIAALTGICWDLGENPPSFKKFKGV